MPCGCCRQVTYTPSALLGRLRTPLSCPPVRYVHFQSFFSLGRPTFPQVADVARRTSEPQRCTYPGGGCTYPGGEGRRGVRTLAEASRASPPTRSPHEVAGVAPTPPARTPTASARAVGRRLRRQGAHARQSRKCRRGAGCPSPCPAAGTRRAGTAGRTRSPRL